MLFSEGRPAHGSRRSSCLRMVSLRQAAMSPAARDAGDPTNKRKQNHPYAFAAIRRGAKQLIHETRSPTPAARHASGMDPELGIVSVIQRQEGMYSHNSPRQGVVCSRGTGILLRVCAKARQKGQPAPVKAGPAAQGCQRRSRRHRSRLRPVRAAQTPPDGLTTRCPTQHECGGEAPCSARALNSRQGRRA